MANAPALDAHFACVARWLFWARFAKESQALDREELFELLGILSATLSHSFQVLEGNLQALRWEGDFPQSPRRRHQLLDVCINISVAHSATATQHFQVLA